MKKRKKKGKEESENGLKKQEKSDQMNE